MLSDEELRDRFACAALAGYRASGAYTPGAYPSESKLWSPTKVAEQAYRDADAMMKQRRNSSPAADGAVVAHQNT